MSARPVARRVFLFVLYAHVAALVLALLLVRGISTYSWATVPALVDGTAHRPFVTRALVPTVVRSIVGVTPAIQARVEAKVAAGLSQSGPGRRLDRALATLGWTAADVYVHLVATAVMFACLLVLPWLWRRLVLVTYDLPPPAADLAPVLGLLALPLFFVPYARYLYDPGTLVLWSIALLAVCDRRRWLVWGLLPVLAYHKETAILLPFVVAVRDWPRAPRSRTLLVLAGQCAVVAVVRYALALEFADNPGGTVLFVGPAHTLDLLTGFLRRPPYVPLVVALFGVLAAQGWSTAPVFVRRAFLTILVPLVLLSLLFGYVDEIRGYYEAFALLILLAVPGVLSLLGASPARPREAT